MYEKRKILALIPARGGSKGLPGKNILPLLGKPLIAWTIEEALKSEYIDRVIVSTDDVAIADIARRHGAGIPFMRPEGLASDSAAAMDVLFHALEWLDAHEDPHGLVALLQPTSPLRLSGDIDDAIRLLFDKGGKAVVSVSKSDHHPYWENSLPPDGNMKNFLRKDAVNQGRQALPDFYRINGAIYIGDTRYLRRKNSFFGNRTFAYIMPRERSVDIDDRLDLMVAEMLLKEQTGRG
jgi:CMP-N,N'-diacetyllegionaminic acid synthase